MKIRSPKDFWSGLIFIGIAIAFIGVARQYNLGNMHRMGPGLFPTLVGALLAGLGLVITLRAFAVDGPPVPRFQARPILVGMAAIVLFGVALQYLGLLAAIAALVLVGAAASRESRAVETIVLALALMLFSAAVFVWLLGLPIPLWRGA
jgi:hypothetical protein